MVHRIDIVEAITRLTLENGYAPSIREIASDVGLSSPDTVAHHLVALRDKGLVTWRPGLSRTLKVVEPV